MSEQTSYPIHNNNNPTNPRALLSALQNYQSNGNETELRAALDNYQAQKARAQQMVLRQPSWYQIMGNALSSFTLFPSGSYDYYIPRRAEQSSAEAIYSHWQAAGEYLSYGIICHILDGENTGAE